MRVKLDSVDVWRPKIHLDLNRLPIVIGRNRDCDVCLEDRWISRRHCEVGVSDGEVVVRDLESRYGTLVNGQHIDQSPLRPGDELTIGVRTLRVWFHAEKSAAAPSDLELEDCHAEP